MTPLNERLSNAEARREEMKKLRKENIDDKLATVQTKKEDMIMEKSNKVKEDVHAYLSKIEQKVKELEVANEAEKIAKKISMDANTNKVEEKRGELLEKRIKELQDHEEYVKQVIANQEMKKKQYLTNLELSLDKASKRKEDQIAKVVENVKVEDTKIAEAKERREREEKELQEKVSKALNQKFNKLEGNLASKEDEFKSKIEEKNRKAEQVKQKKLNLGPESA